MSIGITSWLRHSYRRGRKALALLATASLCGCLPFIYTPSYTPETMITLPTQRTTHCIGRYLIDLPSGFDLKTGGWGNIELYYGLDKNFQRVYATVKQGRFTSEAFWGEVNKRRLELQDTKNTGTKSSMLLHGEKLDTRSALLRRLGDEEYGLSIKTEVHVLVGERYVTLEQQSYSKAERDRDYTTADPGPAETRLKMIAGKLMRYENAERAKPGFCMQGVLFDVGQDDESASFSWQSAEIPDVEFGVYYHAVTGQSSDGLLERMKNNLSAAPLIAAYVANLRRGVTTLAGVPAEESLDKILRPVTQHMFRIERRDSEKSTLDRPFFSLNLSTGNQYRTPVGPGEPPADTAKAHYSKRDKEMVHHEANSSLSDEQSVKLWDEVVASVRKR
jgi:hypothetical protein